MEGAPPAREQVPKTCMRGPRDPGGSTPPPSALTWCKRLHDRLISGRIRFNSWGQDYVAIAQLAERSLHTGKVGGSVPSRGTRGGGQKVKAAGLYPGDVQVRPLLAPRGGSHTAQTCLWYSDRGPLTQWQSTGLLIRAFRVRAPGGLHKRH